VIEVSNGITVALSYIKYETEMNFKEASKIVEETMKDGDLRENEPYQKAKENLMMEITKRDRFNKQTYNLIGVNEYINDINSNTIKKHTWYDIYILTNLMISQIKSNKELNMFCSIFFTDEQVPENIKKIFGSKLMENKVVIKLTTCFGVNSNEFINYGYNSYESELFNNIKTKSKYEVFDLLFDEGDNYYYITDTSKDFNIRLKEMFDSLDSKYFPIRLDSDKE